MKRINGLGIFAGACAVAIGCAVPSGDSVGSSRAALSSILTLSENVSATSTYVGTPLTLWGSLYNSDPSVAHTDVTLKTTITGSFDLNPLDLQFFGYDPTWACSLESGKGLATITCHADTATLKDGFSVIVTPNVVGTVSIDSQLLDGGALVDKFHQDVSVVVASGADLSLYGWGGGTINVGDPVWTSFQANNYGPLASTGTKVTISLKGPGKITDASVFAPLPPPPPPKDPSAPPPPPPPPSPSACTFTDTDATCNLGDMAVWGGLPVNLTFVGTAAGLVTLTGTISGNDSDPMPWNNTASMTYTVVKPAVADLGVTISAPSPVTFKKPLPYTIVVTNNGPDAANGAYLFDFLPPNVTFESVTSTQGSCFGSEWGWVNCDLGPLAAGAKATVTLIGTPTEGGDITNSVNVFNPNWMDRDPDWSNNYASVLTTVRGPNPPVTTTASEQKSQTGFYAYVDCAHDFVSLEGTLHSSYHTTFNKSTGRASYSWMSHPSNVKGTGMYSGTAYEATGKTSGSNTYTGWYPTSYDYEDIFHVVGKGAGADLFLHITNHVTFGTDGTPKVTVSKYKYTCK